MKCSIKGCPGHYEPRLIVHTVKQGEELMVFDDVPAEVCDVCSDTLLAPDTLRHLDALIKKRSGHPRSMAPVYAYQ
jgi:YgiT-type zinc finger domain-containing protein